MAANPPTCHVCGALITKKRGGELVVPVGGGELVWVHPQCRAGFNRADDARWAFLALAEDPLEMDREGWVPIQAVEAQRGLWGSDAADFEAGLAELVAQGWAEANVNRSAYRLTAAGERQRSHFGLPLNGRWASA